MKKLNKFGKLPINCRITIDYSKEKPKITFGYIAKKQQKSSNYVNPISLLITAVLILTLVLLFTLYPDNAPAPLVNTCKVYEQTIDNIRIHSYNISCGNNAEYILEYKEGHGIFPISTLANFYPKVTLRLAKWLIPPKGLLGYLISFLLIIGLIGFTVGFIFFFNFAIYAIGWIIHLIPGAQPYVNKNIPILNKKMAVVRYAATFKKCPEDKIIEIPLFENIFMDYEAKKDFSEYLKRVEIREHPFALLSERYGVFKRIFGSIKKKHKQKYKKERNIYLWKARFIFKEVPKKGSLEVRWK